MQTQAEKIQNLIRKTGVLQKDFAQRLGYKRESSFSRAINSDHIGERTLRKIAAGLGMTTEKLVSVLQHEPPDAEETDLREKASRLEQENKRLAAELERMTRYADALALKVSK